MPLALKRKGPRAKECRQHPEAGKGEGKKHCVLPLNIKAVTSKEKWQAYCFSEKRCIYLLLIPKTACFVLVSFFKIHQGIACQEFLNECLPKAMILYPTSFFFLTLCKVLGGVPVTILAQLL